MEEENKLGNVFTAKNGFRFVLYNINEAKQKPERKAIVQNYFYEKTLNLLYGQSGHGKTWWALYEAICFVLGNKLLDLDIEKDPDGRVIPHRVLYISLEMTAKDISDRIDQLSSGLSVADKAIIANDLHIVSFEDNSNMIAGSAGFITALGDLCKTQNYDIVYIDSFTDYIAGFDERSEDHMRKVLTTLRTFTIENNVSFRIIHHGTKTYSDGSGGSMAGIHTIRDLVDHVFSLKQNKNELTLTSDHSIDPSAKVRYKSPITITVGIQSDGKTYYSFYKKAENEKNSNMTQMSNILTAVRENEGITAKELKEKLGKVDSGLRDSMLGTELIMVSEKSDRGHDKKRFYTMEYYENNLPEIEKGEKGGKRGEKGGNPPLK